MAEEYCFCEDKYLEVCPPHLGIHVQCEECERWFHSVCVGLPTNPVELEKIKFVCKIHKPKQAALERKLQSTVGKSLALEGYAALECKRSAELLGKIKELQVIGRIMSKTWWEYAEQLHAVSKSRWLCAMVLSSPEETQNLAFDEVMQRQHSEERVLALNKDLESVPDDVPELYLVPIKKTDNIPLEGFDCGPWDSEFKHVLFAAILKQPKQA